MPAKTGDIADPIIRRLRALAQEFPDLKDAARMYEAILPLLRDADLHAGAVSLSPEHAREKMEKGRPLLVDLDLDVDPDAVRDLMINLAAAVEKAGKKNRPFRMRLPWLLTSGEPDATVRRIRFALEQDSLNVAALLPHVAAGESKPIMDAAESLGLDPDLAWTLAQNALKPALRAWCGQLSPLAGGMPWNKGSCFVCGAAAALAELQENNQVKHLRCGSCGADWVVNRLQCVHCGNRDHKTQRYFAVEGRQDNVRVEVCDVCKGYLKAVSSFAAASVEMLVVEDLATLHLDYIAQERGYGRSSTREARSLGFLQ